MYKKIFFVIIAGLIFVTNSCTHSSDLSAVQPPPHNDSIGVSTNNQDSVFIIANWNIDWFGSTESGMGPSDKDLQQANVLKVVQFLNPDIIGFAEVVDVERFREITQNLGSDYDFQVSQYGSGASYPGSKNYADAQKLAFIYKKSEFANIQILQDGYLSESETAYTNFASGRFPYYLNADVTKNGVTKNITFFMVHGKSGAEESSYNERKNASNEFEDSLNSQGYDKKCMMILGDFNDELQGTITSNEPISPYINFMQDDDYDEITLSLQQNNATSMIDNLSVIDHQIVSSSFGKMYKSGSAKIRTDVITIIPNYTQGQTSDHYPISSEFIFSKTNANN